MTNTAIQPEYVLTEEIRQKLSGVATPTLHTLLLKRGYRNTYIQGVSRLNRRDIQMVGQAFTLRYIPAREDVDTVEAFKDPAHPQRVAVENVPAGMVLVSDCSRTPVLPVQEASCLQDYNTETVRGLSLMPV